MNIVIIYSSLYCSKPVWLTFLELKRRFFKEFLNIFLAIQWKSMGSKLVFKKRNFEQILQNIFLLLCGRKKVSWKVIQVQNDTGVSIWWQFSFLGEISLQVWVFCICQPWKKDKTQNLSLISQCHLTVTCLLSNAPGNWTQNKKDRDVVYDRANRQICLCMCVYVRGERASARGRERPNPD